MLLLLDKDQYDSNSIYFGEKSINNIIDNSFFYNITYTTPLFTIQQLHINFELKYLSFEPYYNKYKLIQKNVNSNHKTLKKLIYIENSILNSFKSNKIKNLKLRDQIYNNTLKCVSNINVNLNSSEIYNFMIKISGIWENPTEIGLIYKLIVI